MALESILEHILREANAQRDKIVDNAGEQADEIVRDARLEADKLSQELIDKGKWLYLNQKQKMVVEARLGAKKQLLHAKQELIGQVFERLKAQLNKNMFKKERVSRDKVEEVSEDLDFYLNKIRPDYEAEIAKVLFEPQNCIRPFLNND